MSNRIVIGERCVMIPCLTGKLDWIVETYGDRSHEYFEYLTTPNGSELCLLPAGHDGPHAWTPSDQIMLKVMEGGST